MHHAATRTTRAVCECRRRNCGDEAQHSKGSKDQVFHRNSPSVVERNVRLRQQEDRCFFGVSPMRPFHRDMSGGNSHQRYRFVGERHRQNRQCAGCCASWLTPRAKVEEIRRKTCFEVSIPIRLIYSTDGLLCLRSMHDLILAHSMSPGPSTPTKVPFPGDIGNQ